MFWPSAQDYNEAVQNPSSSFADEALRGGIVEVNRLGLPKVMSGAFASVYRVDCEAAPWAVRCFLNSREDQRERYKAISEFVLFDDLDCTVPFYYLERGIRLRGSWFPILKMEWVEGITLEKFLDENFKNGKKVSDLLQQFDAMVLDLARAGIAHGDLQHGNIIVTRNGLRLVDYDALYVPALEGRKSLEIGHPNYQHPKRAETHYDPSVDNFSAWLIHFSLLALTIDPELYHLVEGGDDCILFKRGDLSSPGRSDLFKLLLEHPSTELRQAAHIIASMLAVPPHLVPALGATQSELAKLPDASKVFLGETDATDDERAQAREILQSLSVDTQPTAFSDTSVESSVSLGAPTWIDSVSSEERNGVAYTTRNQPTGRYAVKLAIAKRNISNWWGKQTDGFILRNIPSDWCNSRLQKANHLFDNRHYEEASRIFLELSDVLEYLATSQKFWTIRDGPWSFSLFPFVTFGIVHNPQSDQRLWFDPKRNRVQVLMKLGYCFCFAERWKVASNYFTLAIRHSSRGIAKELRLRSLLLYAACRNEGGERKEALRFMLQKYELVEQLPKVVQWELSASQFIKRVSFFELLVELGKKYFDRVLLSSATCCLLSARQVYFSIDKAQSSQFQALAIDLFFMLGYIHTVRRDFAAAQVYWNDLIELCEKEETTAPVLRRATLCAALSALLNGDLTVATTLVNRIHFGRDDLINEIRDQNSVAHKLLYYDKSRAIAFFLDLADKRRQSPRMDQAFEYYVMLLHVFRSNITTSPLFSLDWLEKLPRSAISQCLERSYFRDKGATRAQLIVLMNALSSSELYNCLKALCERLAQDNMLDELDLLFNGLAAKNKLSVLFAKDEEGKSTADRIVTQLILRLATDQFKEKASADSVIGSQSLQIADLVTAMLTLKAEETKTLDGTIYDARTLPFLKPEFIQFRGVLRFIELYVADHLSDQGMHEESLVLYDKLEGYYSANVDSVLNAAIENVRKRNRIDVDFMVDAVKFSELALKYRGEQGNPYLDEIREIVSSAIREATVHDDLAGVADMFLGLRECSTPWFLLSDTICDAACRRLSSAQTVSSDSNLERGLVDLVLSLVVVYVSNDRLTKARAIINDLIAGWNPADDSVSLRCHVIKALVLKLLMESDAARELAESGNSNDVFAEISTDGNIVQQLAFVAQSKAVELFLDAGDLLRVKQSSASHENNRPRFYYRAASFIFDRIPHPFANRLISTRLADRLSHDDDEDFQKEAIE